MKDEQWPSMGNKKSTVQRFIVDVRSGAVSNQWDRNDIFKYTLQTRVYLRYAISTYSKRILITSKWIPLDFNCIH